MTRPRAIIFTALIITVIASPFITGCNVITGSGETVTWEMVYADFDKLEAGSGFDITVTRADEYKVQITIDKSLTEYLSIEQRGDTLHLRLKPNYTYTDMRREARVSMPELRRLELSGASVGVARDFTTTHGVDFELSGASRLGIGGMQAMKAGSARFQLSGGSRVTAAMEVEDGVFDLSGASSLGLKGSARNIDISASGASEINLPEFPVDTAAVELSGASRANLSVSSRIDIELSGGSNLRYKGDPKLGSINVSGGSTISQE